MDHKPSLPSEIDRIERAGGTVRTSKAESSVPRVDGVLALSRSFGDFRLKQPHNGSDKDWVTVQPQIKGPYHPEGEFYAAAMSDGVTDMASTKEVANWIVEHASAERTGTLEAACQEIVAECVERWLKSGADNVSIAIMRVQPKQRKQ